MLEYIVECLEKNRIEKKRREELQFKFLQMLMKKFIGKTSPHIVYLNALAKEEALKMLKGSDSSFSFICFDSDWAQENLNAIESDLGQLIDFLKDPNDCSTAFIDKIELFLVKAHLKDKEE